MVAFGVSEELSATRPPRLQAISTGGRATTPHEWQSTAWPNSRAFSAFHDCVAFQHFGRTEEAAPIVTETASELRSLVGLNRISNCDHLTTTRAGVVTSLSCNGFRSDQSIGNRLGQSPPTLRIRI